VIFGIKRSQHPICLIVNQYLIVLISRIGKGERCWPKAKIRNYTNEIQKKKPALLLTIIAVGQHQIDSLTEYWLYQKYNLLCYANILIIRILTNIQNYDANSLNLNVNYFRKSAPGFFIK